jgi:uncharacterized membrane protein (UPF0127 family)
MSSVRLAESGSVVVDDLRPAHGLVSRTLGLMFRGPLPEGQALDIRPCSSIHMMFMRFSIDAVFYDRDFRVTKVASNVKPWIGLAFGGKGAKGVIEMKRGAASAVKPGDLLEFSAQMQGSS